jgi:hypothetical protein
MINADQLKQKLVQEYDYNESQVDSVVSKLVSMDTKLLESFNTWIDTGVIPDYPEFGGFTPKKASATYPTLKLPAIFLLLDWLHREPQEALQALYEEFGTVTPTNT